MLRLKVFCLIFGSNLNYKLKLTYGDFPGNIYTCVFAPGGGGVLRYISDGDVRSPFLGLKFAT